MYSTNLSVFLYLTRKAVMELITLFLTEWGYLALFVLMALENMNIPIPSEIILGFAGFLVYKQIFSFIPTIIIGIITKRFLNRLCCVFVAMLLFSLHF